MKTLSICFILGAVLISAMNESQTYYRLTGHRASIWDALRLDLSREVR
jgi:hypothetical protein